MITNRSIKISEFLYIVKERKLILTYNRTAFKAVLPQRLEQLRVRHHLYLRLRQRHRIRLPQPDRPRWFLCLARIQFLCVAIAYPIIELVATREHARIPESRGSILSLLPAGSSAARPVRCGEAVRGFATRRGHAVQKRVRNRRRLTAIVPACTVTEPTTYTATTTTTVAVTTTTTEAVITTTIVRKTRQNVSHCRTTRIRRSPSNWTRHRDAPFPPRRRRFRNFVNFRVFERFRFIVRFVIDLECDLTWTIWWRPFGLSVTDVIRFTLATIFDDIVSWICVSGCLQISGTL